MVEKFFKSKGYMAVAAAPSMQKILEENIKEGDGFLGKSNIPEELQQHIPWQGSGQDIPDMIKVQNLARFYQ